MQILDNIEEYRNKLFQYRTSVHNFKSEINRIQNDARLSESEKENLVTIAKRLIGEIIDPFWMEKRLSLPRMDNSPTSELG